MPHEGAFSWPSLPPVITIQMGPVFRRRLWISVKNIDPIAILTLNAE